MANNTIVFHTVSRHVLLCSVVFKFVAMIIGVLGNVTIIIHTIFWNKEKTTTSYLVGNLAVADLLVCLTFYPLWIVEFVQAILNIENDQDLFCKASRPIMWGLIFASVATLLAITVDRYLYIIKPLKYQLIVTRRRVCLIVLGIWVSACCLFILIYVHVKSYDTRSLCEVPDSVDHLTGCFVGYIPLTLIVFFNFSTLSVERKQRKHIIAETKVADVNMSTEQSVRNISFAHRFLAALKETQTFAIVVAVLAFCILTPVVFGQVLYHFCSESCWLIWFLVFNYELYGINSILECLYIWNETFKAQKSL